MQRRQIIQWGAASLAAPAFAAQAQSFPSKPIKLVIAFPAGGPTDITMRALADNASKILGQPVIVENKPGAGDTLPAQALQTVPADGYTVAQIPLGVFRLPYTTNAAHKRPPVLLMSTPYPPCDDPAPEIPWIASR